MCPGLHDEMSLRKQWPTGNTVAYNNMWARDHNVITWFRVITLRQGEMSHAYHIPGDGLIRLAFATTRGLALLEC